MILDNRKKKPSEIFEFAFFCSFFAHKYCDKSKPKQEKKLYNTCVFACVELNCWMCCMSFRIHHIRIRVSILYCCFVFVLRE